MGPSIRKALGVVKDQTSISLARVSSNLAPELDVAIVKATSHDDEPPEERHVREILTMSSYSRVYVGSCVATVSRRLGKTRDWVVALKALVLVHRLLEDGGSVFHHEFLHATRRGTRLLNMADFRDEAHANSWDLSAFVRTYALYLDQRLEFSVYESGGVGEGRGSGSGRDDDSYGGRDSYRRSYSNKEDGFYGDGGERGHYHRRGGSSFGGERKAATPVREMKPERVLSRMRHLQRLLDRFLACRPTGKARVSRLVLVALYRVVRESFQLYADVCEVLAVLLDRFFEMEYEDSTRAFEAYAATAKQIDELVAFYGWCKDVGVARSSEYPEVQRITDRLLETLEEFLRDKKGGKSPEKAEPPTAAAAAEKEQEEKEEKDTPPPPPPPVEDVNGIKALPLPDEKEPGEKEEENGDLVDLRDEAFTADDQGNKFALALFSADVGSAGGGNANDSDVKSAWQNPAADLGKADWELVLVETASNLSNQKVEMPGGFNSGVLNGMYDHGTVRNHMNSQASGGGGGSASSVALPLPGLGRSAAPVLALPGPDGTVTSVGQDPFSASLSIPPPSYVQMAEVEKKQQFMVQEQQLWEQYTRDGMQGQVSLAKLSMGYNTVSPQVVPAAAPYGLGMPPSVYGGGYQYAHY